jgi:hypothetical protein
MSNYTKNYEVSGDSKVGALLRLLSDPPLSILISKLLAAETWPFDIPIT